MTCVNSSKITWDHCSADQIPTSSRTDTLAPHRVLFYCIIKEWKTTQGRGEQQFRWSLITLWKTALYVWRPLVLTVWNCQLSCLSFEDVFHTPWIRVQSFWIRHRKDLKWPCIEHGDRTYTPYMITDPHPTNLQTGTQYAFFLCLLAILCMYSSKSYETTWTNHGTQHSR